MKITPSSFVYIESEDRTFIAFRLRNLTALPALGLKEIDYSLDYQKKSLIFLFNVWKEKLTSLAEK